MFHQLTRFESCIAIPNVANVINFDPMACFDRIHLRFSIILHKKVHRVIRNVHWGVYSYGGYCIDDSI